MSQTIERYGLNRPSRRDALTSLERLLGDGAAGEAWDRACAAAGVDASRRFLDGGELMQIACALAAQRGLASVAGNSLRVRLITYDQLSGDASLT